MNPRARTAAAVLLTLVAVAGLAVDVYVHFDLAKGFDAIRTSTLSQGDLFRAESVGAIVAGLLVLLRWRAWTAAVAFVVAAGGAGVLLLYRYVNVPGFGPIPPMYEPAWYQEKTLAFWAEVVAGLAALLLFVLRRRRTA